MILRMWIEMSRDITHGGDKWEFGKCIWAPTYKKGAKKGQKWLFWDNVQKVREGDIVFHLLGKGEKAYFVGYSIVEIDGHETKERPPVPGEWGYCEIFYRAFLKEFVEFKVPINLYDLFKRKRVEFEEYIMKKEKPKNIFITKQSNKLQCLNGGYLSEADWELIKLIFGDGKEVLIDNDSVNESVSTSEVLIKTKVRIGHAQFADNVKKNYKNQCCFPNCKISEKDFLVASHIARWADNPQKRGETSNGLCFCLIHDKAFEKGYFSLNDNLEIITFNGENFSEVFEEKIQPYGGLPIKAGTIEPDRQALNEHRMRCRLLRYREKENKKK